LTEARSPTGICLNISTRAQYGATIDARGRRFEGCEGTSVNAHRHM
jgi:hypothetical protein